MYVLTTQQEKQKFEFHSGLVLNILFGKAPNSITRVDTVIYFKSYYAQIIIHRMLKGIRELKMSS